MRETAGEMTWTWSVAMFDSTSSVCSIVPSITNASPGGDRGVRDRRRCQRVEPRRVVGVGLLQRIAAGHGRQHTLELPALAGVEHTVPVHVADVGGEQRGPAPRGTCCPPGPGRCPRRPRHGSGRLPCCSRCRGRRPASQRHVRAAEGRRARVEHDRTDGGLLEHDLRPDDVDELRCEVGQARTGVDRLGHDNGRVAHSGHGAGDRRRALVDPRLRAGGVEDQVLVEVAADVVDVRTRASRAARARRSTVARSAGGAADHRSWSGRRSRCSSRCTCR